MRVEYLSIIQYFRCLTLECREEKRREEQIIRDGFSKGVYDMLERKRGDENEGALKTAKTYTFMYVGRLQHESIRKVTIASFDIIKERRVKEQVEEWVASIGDRRDRVTVQTEVWVYGGSGVVSHPGDAVITFWVFMNTCQEHDDGTIINRMMVGEDGGLGLQVGGCQSKQIAEKVRCGEMGADRIGGND
jgi:hypothetical protein